MTRIAFIIIFLYALNTINAQEGSSARYEIDAKRVGVDPLDKDALPRSREFIRLDSTYYVGHMFEGLYKADKSSDYVGYKNAIGPLRTAFLLFEKDYRRSIKGMFASTQAYSQNMNKYIDYLQIAQILKECYDNIEMADSVMWVLDRVDSYNFPKDHLAVTTSKAWTYHRNRFFTSNKFAFLKNSVQENEQMAFQECYNALGKIERNEPTNNAWFGAGQAEQDRQNVYHYLSLLHAYNKNYDSSENYYQRLANYGMVSWNNYGNFKHELGEFAVAKEYFNKDKFKSYEKMLKEPYYFLPMLDVYSGNTKEAMSTSKEAIEYAGSTPGFGWYNISLGRSYLYDGQIDSAEMVLNKATAFKEIHIGTTLTQSQYDFSINLLSLQVIDRKLALEKFNDDGWWYSPSSLFKLLTLKIEKLLLQYVLINQMAANPERERVVYDLFCGEATTSFDEAWYLIRDFSPSYFIKKYETYQKADPRKKLIPYFKLFTHQMQWADGNEDEALEGYEQLMKEVKPDVENEQLFLARLYEGLAKGYEDDGSKDKEDYYTNALFEDYPQLVPYSGLTMKMKLSTSGIDDAVTKDLIEELKDCNIKWVDEADGNTAIARINFIKRGDKYEASVTVKGGTNKLVVADQKMIFKTAEGAGKELALRLFGKGGAMVYETAL